MIEPNTTTKSNDDNSCYSPPFRVDARNLKAQINGVEYEWIGGFGAVLKSRERGIKEGDCRMIGDVQFYAYMVNGPAFWNPEVCWTIPNRYINHEWIHSFKAAFCGI